MSAEPIESTRFVLPIAFCAEVAKHEKYFCFSPKIKISKELCYNCAAAQITAGSQCIMQICPEFQQRQAEFGTK